MAKNFKRVRRDSYYRHLGNDTYHAAFLFELRTLHGRSSIRQAQIWEFVVPGMRWASLFLPEVVVRSPHSAVFADTGTIAHSGKDEVRSALLRKAWVRAKDGLAIPGFKRLWGNQLKGTVSACVIEMTKVSHRLEMLPVQPLVGEVGTRCPDCGRVRCDDTCPGVT